MTKEEKKNMSIANCRICLLSKSNCAECPLNWALDFLDIEKTLKVIKIPIEDITIPVNKDNISAFLNIL